MASALEAADIFRRHGEAFRQAHGDHLGYVERRVMGAITACRTAALGGHVEQCDDCGTTTGTARSARGWHAQSGSPIGPRNCCRFPISTSSSPCRRRSLRSPSTTRPPSTPSCSAPPPRRSSQSPPIPAISAPASASPPCSTPGAKLSRITRMSIASCPVAAPRSMARAGSPAAPDSSSRCEFLRDCFDGCSCATCRKLMTPAGCASPGPLAGLADADAFKRIDWVVYAKPPFGGPRQALAYLGRYTHRVAIANSRLLALEAGKVRFTWKDYRKDGVTKVMTLDATEFIRRFLLHTLPDGFHRIRHYGFLANGDRHDNLDRCRRLIALDAAATRDQPHAAVDPPASDQAPAAARCPDCGGVMRRIALVPRSPCSPRPFFCDTS